MKTEKKTKVVLKNRQQWGTQHENIKEKIVEERQTKLLIQYGKVKSTEIAKSE